MASKFILRTKDIFGNNVDVKPETTVVTEELSAESNSPVSSKIVYESLDSVEDNAKKYTNQSIANLIDGAPETMDTLKEVHDAMVENESVVQALQNAIGSKAPSDHTHTTKDITNFPTSMPASDVYDWAKAQNKPTYNHNEVGAAAAMHTHEKSDITDFPTLGTASAKDVASSGNASDTQVVMGNDTRLSDARPASDVAAWAKAENKPTYTASEVGAATASHNHDSNYAAKSHTHTKSQISDFPTLGTASAKDVASSGNASSTQVVMGNDTRLSDARPASDVSAWAKASTKPTYTASEVGAATASHNHDSAYAAKSHTHTKSNITDFPTLGTASAKDVASSGNASSAQVVMGNDTRLTDSRKASDVYAWAKASTKPSYTASEVGAISSTLKGTASGVAELDANGKVPSSQLPSYVDDVIEGYLYNGKFYLESSHTTEITGETGKIYIDLATDKTYRWTGTKFGVVSDTIALGETSSTAYRGDRGKIAYDHSQATHARTDATNTAKSSTNGNILINGTETTVYTHPSGTNPHGTTKSDVGLGNVPNVATNDQTPTYTEASSTAKLTSGEKLSVAFGKISKAITDFISHVADSVKHITSTERTNWNAAKTHADSAHAPSGAQANVIETVKVAGSALTPSSKAVDINLSNFGVTSTAAELNVLDGITATTAELNYVDGVTSNIQTQLNSKAASSHGTHVSFSTTAPVVAGTASVGSATTVSRSDHVHPAQTSVSGNAGTATKLATARTIALTGSVTGSGSFDGSGNLSIATTTNHTHTKSQISDFPSTMTPSAHNQASSTINAMTGYSKPSSTSAIATSDTLNAAIGKLEKALDGKQASGSYAAASHTHNYAGSSSAGGAATSLSYFKCTSTSNVGIDDTTANGIGYVSGTSSILSQNDGALYKQVYSAALVHEIYGDYRTGQIALRGKNNGTWQSWRIVLDSGNYKSYCTPANIGAAASSHTHSYAGSSSAGGAATSAVKLSTARTIQTNLGSTSSASFDGSANVTPGVTGTLPVANGGTGATTAANARSNLGLGAAATYSVTTSATSGSTALITSGAVYSGLAGKAASSHGNHVPATQSASNKVFLRNDNTWQTVTPANIGAAAASHNQAASTVTAGTLAGRVQANASAAATLGNAQVRDIYAGTSDLTAGSSALTTGTIYIVYE